MSALKPLTPDMCDVCDIALGDRVSEGGAACAWRPARR